MGDKVHYKQNEILKKFSAFITTHQKLWYLVSTQHNQKETRHNIEVQTELNNIATRIYSTSPKKEETVRFVVVVVVPLLKQTN